MPLDADFTPQYSLANGPEAARAYLAASRPDLSDARLTYLDAGVMNYVYRLDSPEGVYFLKQALGRVKQHDRLGADLAGVSPARIEAEFRALTLLGKTLPPLLRDKVPQVAHLDLLNNILWTRAVAPGSVSLHDDLLAGRCDAQAAHQCGRMMGAVHAADCGNNIPLWPDDTEDRQNWERFFRMRTTGFLERARLSPEAEAAVHRLVREGADRVQTGMISHLDAAPKNWLIGGEDVALLDFELGASQSDPAYDPGFLAGHYLLLGEDRPAMREAAEAAAEMLATGYLQTAPPQDSGWESRFRRYAALTMLYRLHGSSPAPYLNPERYSAIHESGVARLLAAS